MRARSSPFVFGIVAFGLVACVREEPRPTSPRSAPSSTSISSAAAKPPPSACLVGGSAALVLVRQGETVHTPMGVDVTFVGSMHDDYDDGRFDDLVELRFARGDATETRLVSIYAQPSVGELFDDLCWELSAAKGAELRLTFYPRVAR